MLQKAFVFIGFIFEGLTRPKKSLHFLVKNLLQVYRGNLRTLQPFGKQRPAYNNRVVKPVLIF